MRTCDYLRVLSEIDFVSRKGAKTQSSIGQIYPSAFICGQSYSSFTLFLKTGTTSHTARKILICMRTCDYLRVLSKIDFVSRKGAKTQRSVGWAK